MNIFKKPIMQFNILQTETECIDLPKDIIYRAGEYVVIDEKEYLIDRVRYHIFKGKIFQITYVAYIDKKEPLTKEQIKLFLSMGLPLYS